MNKRLDPLAGKQAAGGPKGSLLLVDDDRHVLASMADWLRSLGYQVDTASGCAEAKAAMDRRGFEVILADIRLDDGDGFDVLAHARQHLPAASVILITGYGTVESAVEAIRAGAFDFLTKPLIDAELEMAIGRALHQREVIEENRSLKAQLDLRFGMENIVGHDHRMLKIYDMIDAVADTKATVLDQRRERDGQVDDRPGDPSPQLAARQAVRGGGLRGLAGDAAGKRALRTRGRGLHRRRRATSSASSCRPTAARSSSTRSPRPAPACRSSCSACSRTSSSSRSAARGPSPSTPA